MTTRQNDIFSADAIESAGLSVLSNITWDSINDTPPFVKNRYCDAANLLADFAGQSPTEKELLHKPMLGEIATENLPPGIYDSDDNTRIFVSDIADLILKNADTAKSLIISTSTHKLLTLIISLFTKQCSSQKQLEALGGISLLSVKISLKELAALCGVKDIHSTDSKKAKNALDNFRKLVNKDLDILPRLVYHAKNRNTLTFTFISTCKLSGGFISATINPDFAQILCSQCITQTSKLIFLIPNNKPNAYRLALKLQSHYFMTSNVEQKVHNKLKLSSLLNVTNLPSLESAREMRASPFLRIITPLIENLLYLQDIGFLDHFNFLDDNKKILSSDDLSKLPYEKWEQVIFVYDMKNAKDYLPTPSQKKKRTRKKVSA